MDSELPADSIYTYLGVAIVSVAMMGIVVALPTTVPPNAANAANTIDEVAASGVNASATQEHSAESVRIGVEQIALKNKGGTRRASVVYGPLTWVSGSERLDRVLSGASISSQFADRTAFFYTVEAHQQYFADTKWRPADDRLRVRHIVVGGRHVTLVDA